MSKTPKRFAIVVDPDCGLVLTTLPKQPIWVVDSAANREAVDATDNLDVTTFVVDAHRTRDSWVIEVLPAVDDHHGLRQESADDVILDVRGVSVTQGIRAALNSLGPFAIQEQSDGFLAVRTASQADSDPRRDPRES
jgi:hypothetical protein